MERLRFWPRGQAAERLRSRFKRVVVGWWVASVIGALAGIPFSEAGISFATGLISPPTTPAGGFETSESVPGLMKFRSGVFDARPVPTPTPTPEPEPEPAVAAAPAPLPPAPAGSIQAIIYDAAKEYGVDPAWLLSIAQCESGLNPNAVSPAGYYGLFQYDKATWASNGYGSIFDPVAQSRTTARLIAGGQASKWANCL